jgi:hypothetical protein
MSRANRGRSDTGDTRPHRDAEEMAEATSLPGEEGDGWAPRALTRRYGARVSALAPGPFRGTCGKPAFVVACLGFLGQRIEPPKRILADNIQPFRATMQQNIRVNIDPHTRVTAAPYAREGGFPVDWLGFPVLVSRSMAVSSYALVRRRLIPFSVEVSPAVLSALPKPARRLDRAGRWTPRSPMRRCEQATEREYGSLRVSPQALDGEIS